MKLKTARALLNKSEKLHLKLYEQKWRLSFDEDAKDNPNAVFLLGDNPLTYCTWTRGMASSNGQLPAFKKSAGKLWIASKERWMTPREKLAALGYPVYEMMAEAARCDLLQIDSPDLHAQAGNAWHISNAGMIMVVALACFEFTQTWAC